MKKSILFHQACTSGWRRGSELRREVAAGCWDRSTFKALSFHLFSFCISLLFRWKGKGERGGGRETIHVLKHTEERPGWPSLIKGIFQGRLTSLSTMLRQDSPTANSPPPLPPPNSNKLQLPEGDFYLCLGEKSSNSHPKCHHKWESSGTHLWSQSSCFYLKFNPTKRTPLPLISGGNIAPNVWVCCSSFLISIQEARIYPVATFNPLHHVKNSQLSSTPQACLRHAFYLSGGISCQSHTVVKACEERRDEIEEWRA